jgi:dihydroorotate dehydrogenase (NAD+) catalytic subunit
MAGATAVQVGTATFADPQTMLRIIDGLQAYCEENGLENIAQVRGIV